MEKRNDDKGYERGAKGIDGKEGENYGSAGQDAAKIRDMYGRAWPGGKVQ